MFLTVIGNAFILALFAGLTIFYERENRNPYPLGIPFIGGFILTLMLWAGLGKNEGSVLLAGILGGLFEIGLFSLWNWKLKVMRNREALIKHNYDWN